MTTGHLTRRELLNAGAAIVTAALAPPLVAGAHRGCNFLVLGDWGVNGAARQREVAAQMAKAAEQFECRYIVSVGDNFYNDGVQSATDPQWRASYEEIYAAPSLQVPWYVALGNHDYRGVPQAQLDYAKSSPRWRMPSRYFKVAGSEIGAPHLDLFFIDTSPLVQVYRERADSAIAVNVASQDVPAQLHWLDTQLSQSSAPWKLVIGHHTIHSGGSAHGDTPEMVQLVDPLLRKHGVQAYINGHDHDLQHVRRNGLNYIGSGGGFEARPVNSVDGTLFCMARPGFAVMQSDMQALRLEFRDFEGVTLYQTSIPRSGGRAHNSVEPSSRVA